MGSDSKILSMNLSNTFGKRKPLAYVYSTPMEMLMKAGSIFVSIAAPATWRQLKEVRISKKLAR